MVRAAAAAVLPATNWRLSTLNPPWNSCLPDFGPAFCGRDATARRGGQSSINDRHRPCPTCGPAAYFHGKTAHHEAFGWQRLQIVQLFDMAIADFTSSAMSLPDQ